MIYTRAHRPFIFHQRFFLRSRLFPKTSLSLLTRIPSLRVNHRAWKGLMGLLNISGSRPIDASGKPARTSGRECSKKHALSLSEGSIQQGRSPFDARSVLTVREHGKRARTPLAAFFNIPLITASNLGIWPSSMRTVVISNPSTSSGQADVRNLGEGGGNRIIPLPVLSPSASSGQA